MVKYCSPFLSGTWNTSSNALTSRFLNLSNTPTQFISRAQQFRQARLAYFTAETELEDTYSTLLDLYNSHRIGSDTYCHQGIQRVRMMTRFNDLPLEIRSLIFENCLQNILDHQPFKHGNTYYIKYGHPNPQDVAANELEQLFHVIQIVPEHLHELKRIVNKKLRELREAGPEATRLMCTLGQNYELMCHMLFADERWVDLVKLGEASIDACRRVRMLEWQCNLLEDVMKTATRTKLQQCGIDCRLR